MASKTIRIINGGGNTKDDTCYWSETIQNINNIIKNNIPSNAEITRVGVYCSADYDGGLGNNPYKAYLQFGFGTSTAINIHLLSETRITKEPTLYPSNRGLDITSYLSSRFYPWGINAGGQERFLAIVYTSSVLISKQKMEYADLVIDYETHTHSYTTETARTPSTCYTKGSVTKKCSCGQTQTTELALDSNNHAGGTEIKNITSATCTVNGYTGDTCCKGCGAKLKNGSTIAAIGHKYTSQIISPSVAADGYTYHVCSNCGDSYKDNYTINKISINKEIQPIKIYIDKQEVKGIYFGKTKNFWK